VENKHQRIGAVSNAHAGRKFEEAVRLFFKTKGLPLKSGYSVPVGYGTKRQHKFDLGSDDPPILVECKSYTWTISGKSPSAKIRGMNEAMLLFAVAPPQYRKILVLLKHVRGEKTLGTHYIKTQGHLITPGVEVWEFDSATATGGQIL
jgi:hypothetical protein